MKTAEEFLKEIDIPNEVITVQRDGFIEGNRVSFLMEEYAKLTRPIVTEGEIKAIAQKVAEESGGAYYGDYYKAAKLAIKELLKQKR